MNPGKEFKNDIHRKKSQGIYSIVIILKFLFKTSVYKQNTKTFLSDLQGKVMDDFYWGPVEWTILEMKT